MLERLLASPFELEELSDRMLTLKAVFLLVISSLIKWEDQVGDSPSYLDLAGEMVRYELTYVPNEQLFVLY